jgi:hypothetical protein
MIREQLIPMIRENGLSRCAEAIGIHPQSLSAYMAGRRELPVKHIEAIIATLGATLIIKPPRRSRSTPRASGRPSARRD